MSNNTTPLDPGAGPYLLQNARSGTMLDMSLINPGTIHGWDRHGRANQQVEISSSWPRCCSLKSRRAFAVGFHCQRRAGICDSLRLPLAARRAADVPHRRRRCAQWHRHHRQPVPGQLERGANGRQLSEVLLSISTSEALQHRRIGTEHTLSGSRGRTRSSSSLSGMGEALRTAQRCVPA